MSTVTFQINDYSTGGSVPTVQVTITENADGTLTFNIVQLTSAGAYLGDLRGFFFDINESLLNTLCVKSSAGYDAAGNCVTSMTDSQGLGTGNSTTGDNVTNLGDGSNMEGLLNADGTKTVKLVGAEANGYDVGIEIGTSGIGGNDVRSFTFTLATTDSCDLSLSDFVNSDFGIRITSIGQDTTGDGVIDTSREASVKLTEDIGQLASGIALSNSTVAENNVGAYVGTLSALGPDAGAVSYSVTDSRFEVVGSQLKLRGGVSLDFESVQSIDVDVTASGAGWSVSQTFTIDITDVNEAPVITSDGAGATASVSINENTTAVADVNASDEDQPAQTLTYSIVGGADQARFQIDANTGVLSFVSAPNYEAPADAGPDNVYDVVVQVSDGTLSDTQAIAVTVQDVNEAPVITSDGAGATAAVSVVENTNAVTTVTAVDPDSGTTLTYSIIGGADADKFSINATTGALSFISPPNFELPTDAGTNNVYDVIIRASDGELHSDQALAVSVTNEGPTDIQMTVTAIPGPNLPSNTTFGQFSVPTGEGNGGPYSFALLSLNISSLDGNSVSDATPDVTVSASGALSTGNGQTALASNRIYELQVQVTEGAESYHEFFSIITGTSVGETVDGIATAGDDAIYGLTGIDMIFAGSGNDTVFGQNGSDHIHGGDGNDRLHGGNNNDTFYFDTPLDAVDNVDTIVDFTNSEDVIWLSKSVFSALSGGSSTGTTLASTDFASVNDGTGGTANIDSAHIVYDSNTGNLYYDADGGDATNRTLFAVVENKPPLAQFDFNDVKVSL
jgi:Ca2+-binding RTX toxin-like protein